MWHYVFDLHCAFMCCHNLLNNQKPQPMPQVQTLIYTFHVVRLFFYLLSLFRRQTYSVICNRERKTIMCIFQIKPNFAASRIMFDAVLHKVVDCP